MMFCIEHMLEEIDAAEEYCKAAHNEPVGSEARRTYKNIALQELSQFEMLLSLYNNKMQAEMAKESKTWMPNNDIWCKYFKKKAEKLKIKIGEV